MFFWWIFLLRKSTRARGNLGTQEIGRLICIAVTGRENSNENVSFFVYLLWDAPGSDIGHHTWGARRVGVYCGTTPGATVCLVRSLHPDWSRFSINLPQRGSRRVQVGPWGVGARVRCTSDDSLTGLNGDGVRSTVAARRHLGGVLSPSTPPHRGPTPRGRTQGEGPTSDNFIQVSVQITSV